MELWTEPSSEPLVAWPRCCQGSCLSDPGDFVPQTQTSESRGRTCSWSVHRHVPTLLVAGWERKHAVLPVSLLLPMKTGKEAFLPTQKNV